MQTVLTIHTPNPRAPPTHTGFIHRTLSRKVTESLVAAARLRGCTFFAVAYAAAVLATLSVRRPVDANRSTISHWFIPHNLRSQEILAQMSDVANALGVVVLDPGNLQRFLEREVAPSLEDLWVLAREVKVQIDYQRGDMATVALWGGAMQVGSLDPALSERLSKYVRFGVRHGTAADKFRRRDVSSITNPELYSLGVIDGILPPRREAIFVSEPSITVRTCYASPPLGPYVTLHAFTWQGELHVDLSYPEAVVGTNDEQEAALQKGGEATGSLLAWVNKFIEMLQLAAETSQ